jgi:hypothetical protein
MNSAEAAQGLGRGTARTGRRWWGEWLPKSAPLVSLYALVMIRVQTPLRCDVLLVRGTRRPLMPRRAKSRRHRGAVDRSTGSITIGGLVLGVVASYGPPKWKRGGKNHRLADALRQPGSRLRTHPSRPLWSARFFVSTAVDEARQGVRPKVPRTSQTALPAPGSVSSTARRGSLNDAPRLSRRGCFRYVLAAAGARLGAPGRRGPEGSRGSRGSGSRRAPH